MKGFENIYRRVLSLLSASVLTTFIAFVSTPIIVRLLGPGGYGDYAVLLSIFSLYMIPVSSGVTTGVQKFVAEDRDSPRWQEHVIRFYAMLAFGTVLVGVVVLVGFTAAGGGAYVFGEEFTLYLYLLAALVLVAQFFSLCNRILLGMSLELFSGPLTVAKKFFTVTFGIALVLSGLHVEGMIAGHIAAELLVFCVAAYLIAGRISLRGFLGRLPNSFPYRDVMSFNALNIVLILLIMSLFHVDIIMLRTLSDSETTGFYKAALALAEYLWIVPIVLKTVLLHSSSTLWSRNRTEQITDIATRVTRYTLLLVVLMAIGIAVLAHRFVPLYYGPEFTVAVVPLLLLLPGAVGFAAARPLKAISQGSGQMRVLIIATGIAATMNLVLNGALIPVFGMNGAAVATSISYGSMFLLLVWAAWQIGYDPLSDVRMARIGATAVLAAPVIWLVERSIAVDLLAFVLVPILGFVVFGAVTVGTGAVTRSELEPVLARLPPRVTDWIDPPLSWLDEL